MVIYFRACFRTFDVNLCKVSTLRYTRAALMLGLKKVKLGYIFLTSLNR